MDKAPDAFRTISEVADVLETPAHVLRFWESRFPQIKPVKRAGGRRYYRPADVALLSGIRHLLHVEGMTIRGVQKILREQGIRHVAALGGVLGAVDLEEAEDVISAEAVAPFETEEAAPPLMGQVLAMPSGAGPLRPVADPPPQGAGAAVQSLFPTLPDMRPPAPAHLLAEAEEPVIDDSPDALPAEPGPAEAALAGAIPRAGEGGFLAFSAPRRPKAAPSGEPPKQAKLPLDEPVPEAPHIFVEDEAEAPEGRLHSFGAPEALDQDAADDSLIAAYDIPLSDFVEPPVADVVDTNQRIDSAAPELPATEGLPLPDLSGLAARLRALEGPLSPATQAKLAELHPRLGLLLAQMVEAQRPRR